MALRGLKFRKCRRVVDELGSELNGSRLGARLGHSHQHPFFLGRESLDGGDQVGNQIGTTLVLIDHFRPGSLHRLVLGLQLVITTTRETYAREHQQQIQQQLAHRILRAVDNEAHQILTRSFGGRYM